MFPLRRRLSRRLTIVAIASIWAFATLSGLPYVLLSEYYAHNVHQPNGTDFDVHYMCNVLPNEHTQGFHVM